MLKPSASPTTPTTMNKVTTTSTMLSQRGRRRCNQRCSGHRSTARNTASAKGMETIHVARSAATANTTTMTASKIVCTRPALPMSKGMHQSGDSRSASQPRDEVNCRSAGRLKDVRDWDPAATRTPLACRPAHPILH